MGEVYLAKLQRDAGFEKLVAVKRILPHLADDPSFVQLFEAEARLSALLNHPNVVQVYDFGRSGRECFLAMELVDGFDLRALMDLGAVAEKPLGLALSVRIAADVARALDYAHRRTGPSGEPLRLVHRDVSPQNILISLDGDVKVTDFGLAKALHGGERSQSGTIKGKLNYMAPEQARSEEVDVRSDVYALGAVVYELLSGTRLQLPETPFSELVHRVSVGLHRPLADVAPALPLPLVEIVERALQPDREGRFESAGHLERALREAAERLRLSASSDTLAEYVRRFAPLRKVQASLARLPQPDEPGAPEETIAGRRPITRQAAEALAHEDEFSQPDLPRRERTRLDPSGGPIGPNRRPWIIAAIGLAIVALAAVYSSLRAQMDEARADAPRTDRGVEPVVQSEPPRSSPPADPETPQKPTEPKIPPPSVAINLSGAPVGATCYVYDTLRDRDLLTGPCPPSLLVSPGPIRIQVTAPMHAPKMANVVVSPEKPYDFDASLDIAGEGPCTIRVVTTPSNALVTLDGKPLPDRSPTLLASIAPGEHRMLIQKAGYIVRDETVTCVPTAPGELKYTLAPSDITLTVDGRQHVIPVGGGGNYSTSGGAVRVKALARATGVQVTLESNLPASVALDGKDVGPTPATFSLVFGKSHRAELRRPTRPVDVVHMKALIGFPN